MDFGQWLLVQIAEREWERQDFIAKVGYAGSTVGRWIAGSEPGSTAIIRIAEVLGLTPEEVLYRSAGYDPPGPLTPRSDDDVALAEEVARLTSRADALSKVLANRARARQKDAEGLRHAHG